MQKWLYSSAGSQQVEKNSLELSAKKEWLPFTPSRWCNLKKHDVAYG
ncbi:hypothetical protein [Brevibacillus laterosporus]|nr:hypothetical protein [Brevibacillus laterosporus]MDN9009330.1 hypothetical protein [Brevibacillus laterosporus]MDO0940099.1 hypothetical protein [Brevibacillus laterosporus]